MKKNKLMIMVGTRPEIIRLSAVIKNAEPFFEVVLVHTGQNYDHQLSEVFFEEFELKKPDYYLNTPGKNLGETVGNIISKTYDVMVKEKPAALLILGDTNSCLSAYSAKRLKIPIFHMEAGNRCFDFNVPEEINRRLVDHISDINLAYTENARNYLINEGMKNDSVFVTGSPMVEVIKNNLDKIKKSKVLKELNLKKEQYIVVSAHREENIDIDNNFEKLIETINLVATEYKKPIIFSTHPRTMNRIKEKNIKFNSLVKNIEPFGFFDYLQLQQNSFCVLSDSGTLAEEAAILSFPGISLRTSTERPEALDAGAFVLGGIDSDNILSAINIATGSMMEFSHVKDYQDDDVSKKVIKIIQSYFNIVNKRTW
ncbi:UDP-N-acetylglucosamine 2-epimerase (non-hydrolyzing), partial [bacterium]|nr:UDP-N-acetylglucosamine 2-epimerase (non-hydrolyzing) [bacterium]